MSGDNTNNGGSSFGPQKYLNGKGKQSDRGNANGGNSSNNNDNIENDNSTSSANSAIIDSDLGFDLSPDVISNNGTLSTTDIHHRRSPSINTRRQAFIQINQLQYNNNRLILAQAIQNAIELMKNLQVMNKAWPVYYPKEAIEDKGSGEGGSGSSLNGNDTAIATPTLLGPSARQLQIFKLDLKSTGSNRSLLNSLERNSVASLLEGKILQTLKHLDSLKERINDTASKVLITGDLNAGKSTFCNALLRRKVLPEDQQPCTNVFCEVRDCRDNDGVEQVHAVIIGRTYDRNDEATYEIFTLEDLDNLVYEYEKYSILKVYVDEKRPPNESLLRNGVVDISIIDAPGLNLDSYQTTQVFSRQEEIDLVVFVVSAENHFTLSAKEFIANAAKEKSFIFIVVNRFDNIKDKSRCMRRIMNQVAELSPQTHKDASEFVHFVSSKDVSEEFLRGSGGGGGGGGDDGDGDGDGGNGGGNPLNPNFDQLEESLRNFVLEKRSLSKLAPAKTYLNNILLDIEILSEVNINFTKSERDLRLHELDDMNPKFENVVSNSVKISEKIDHDIEACVDSLYEYTTDHVNKVLSQTGQLPSVQYSSIFDSYNYANSIRSAIIQRIQDAIYDCEVHARKETSTIVNSIKSLGILHLGDQPAFMKVFKEDAMFTRRKDTLARSIKAELSLTDFISTPSWIKVIFNPLSLLPGKDNASQQLSLTGGIAETSLESVSTVNNALTVASVIGGSQVVLRSNWLNHTLHAIKYVDFQLLKRLAIPTIIVGSVFGIGYILSEIPNSVPKNVSRKIAKEVSNLGYVHANADRISKESRKVLKYPAQDVRTGFQRVIETQSQQREECEKSAKEAQAGHDFFTKLHSDAAHQRAAIEKCNLEVSLEVD